MDYENKYKEALGFIEKVYRCSNDQDEKKRIEEIFPELAKSEYERIRKRLLELFKGHWSEEWYGLKVKDVIAWLEKQGEQKPNPCDGCVNRKGCINCENGELREVKQKPTDKIEPKFHEGEWVVSNRYTSKPYCITKICDTHYLVDNDSFIPFEQESDWRLWTIQDAKDGDVLYSPCCKLLWIYKDDNSCYVGNNISYNENCVVVNSSICIPSDVCPATKEQRDLLFQKMHDAGYEWDAEKKELKKIQKLPKFKKGDTVKDPYGDAYHIIEVGNDSYKTDDGRFILFANEDAYTRFNPAWSEEDKTVLDNLIYSLANDRIGNNRDEYVDWLKSLKERYTWKPSDEQMDALETAVSSLQSTALESLYQDLKRL